MRGGGGYGVYDFRIIYRPLPPVYVTYDIEKLVPKFAFFLYLHFSSVVLGNVAEPDPVKPKLSL